MKLALKTAFAALTALAAGCASNADGTERAEDAIVNAAPDAADPDYLVFASHGEALAWFETLKPLIGFGPATTVFPESDERTQRVARLVASHWETVQRRFGVTLPVPMPLVVEAPVANAFVIFDPRPAKLVNAIMVLTPMLSLTDAELDAIMLHELAHVVRKHIVPGAQQAHERFYESGPVEKIGLEQPDDPAARAAIGSFLEDATEVGPWSFPELQDVPAARANLGLYLTLADRGAGATNPECTKLVASQNALFRTINASMTFDKRALPNEAQKAELATAVQDIRTQAAGCLAPSPGLDFPTAAANQIAALAPGQDPAALREQFLAAFGPDAHLFEGKDALAGLFDMTKHLRGRVEAALASPSHPYLRRYTTEEEADDFAMTVLHLDGDDAKAVGHGVTALLPPTSRDACEAFIATGAVPHYDLPALHHSECYRRYHSIQFDAYLSAGGAGVTVDGQPGAVKGRRAFDSKVDRILVD